MELSQRYEQAQKWSGYELLKTEIERVVSARDSLYRAKM